MEQTDLDKAVMEILDAFKRRVDISTIRKASKHFGISPTTGVRINQGYIPDMRTIKKIEEKLRGKN